MAYCTITDVNALNPSRTYDASSKPTLTQVNSFIDRIANEIDSILSSRGMDVPVTSPQTFVDHLKQVNANGAAGYAEMSMFPEQTGPMSTGHGYTLWMIYQNQLKGLKSMELPVTVQGAEPFSFFTEHNSSDEPAEDYAWRDAAFRRSKEF